MHKDEDGCKQLQDPFCRFMIRPREQFLSDYHQYPVIDESTRYYIVEDAPTLPDCIPMRRYGSKLLALPKDKWERVPKVVWRDVTKDCQVTFCGESSGFIVSPTDPDFEITIKRRTEVKE